MENDAVTRLVGVVPNNFRTYKVYFWREISDECTDQVETVQAESVEAAIRIAKLRVKIFKRVFRVEEI